MTDDELDVFERMWADGIPMSDIANALSFSARYLNSVARKNRERFPLRHAWSTEKRVYDSETLERAGEMFDSGMSIRGVAKELGISPSSAYRLKGWRT